jgi:hypothetical protein
MHSHGTGDDERVEEAALPLAEHRLHGRAFDRFPESLAPTDEPHASWIASGDVVVVACPGLGRVSAMFR